MVPVCEPSRPTVRNLHWPLLPRAETIFQAHFPAMVLVSAARQVGRARLTNPVSPSRARHVVPCALPAPHSRLRGAGHFLPPRLTPAECFLHLNGGGCVPCPKLTLMLSGDGGEKVHK